MTGVNPDNYVFLMGAGGGRAWVTANTKSAWYELTPAIPFAISAITIRTLTDRGDPGSPRIMFDIATGASGSERVLIPNVTLGTTILYTRRVGAARVPLALPRGARIAIRWQGTVDWPAFGRPLLGLEIQLHRSTGQGEGPVGGPVTAIGPQTSDTTSTLPLMNLGYGTTAWTEVTAAAPHDVRTLMLSGYEEATGNSFHGHIRVGVGAAGSERALAQLQIPDGPTLHAADVRIPRGSRIALQAVNVTQYRPVVHLFG
jgi:hypothetical protein